MTLIETEDHIDAAREIAKAARKLDRMIDDLWSDLPETAKNAIPTIETIGELDAFDLYRGSVNLIAFFEGMHAASEGITASPHETVLSDGKTRFPHDKAKHIAWSAGNRLALGETGGDVEINPVEERATP